MKRRSNIPMRHGAAYIVALLAGTIVTITGLSALSIATTQARTRTLSDQHTMSQLMARTMMEHAKSAVAAHLRDGNTRLDLPGNIDVVLTSPYGDGYWRFAELDGARLNNIDGPVAIQLHGENGDALFHQEALLFPAGETYDVMGMAMYSGGSLTLRSGASVTSELPIGAVGGVTADAAIVDAPVESAGSISGAAYLGSVDSDAASRLMPSDTLFGYYTDLGERIILSDLPFRAGSYWLEDLVLSPSENPFGATNPLGIYVIDCGGSWVTLRNVRVVGTLVLLNASNSVWIGQNTLIQPTHPWMPSLLVEGDAGFYAGDTGPSEAAAGINMNPRGTPYQFESDSDRSDVYPAEIQGVAYVSGDAVFYLPSQTIRGKLIAGGDIRVRTGVDVDIFPDPDVERYPPFGFFEDTGGLALDPNTITWTMP